MRSWSLFLRTAPLVLLVACSGAGEVDPVAGGESPMPEGPEDETGPTAEEASHLTTRDEAAEVRPGKWDWIDVAAEQACLDEFFGADPAARDRARAA